MIFVRGSYRRDIVAWYAENMRGAGTDFNASVNFVLANPAPRHRYYFQPIHAQDYHTLSFDSTSQESIIGTTGEIENFT